MKKLCMLLLATLTAVCLCFGLVACNKDPQPLSAPENVKVSGETLTWNAVEGADSGYTVKINNDETTKVTATSLDLTTVTAKLNEGANTLSVKANATETAAESPYSQSVAYTYTKPVVDDKQPLPAPTIQLQGTVVSWQAVEGATAGYTVKINSDETTKVNVTLLDLTTVTSKLHDGENTVSVRANATETAKQSPYGNSVTYTYDDGILSAPTGVKVEGVTLSWNAVEGATEGYTVKINSDETTVVEDGTTLDLTTVEEKLTEGANTLSVKANQAGEQAESPYSQTVSYTYVKPTPLTLTEWWSVYGTDSPVETQQDDNLIYYTWEVVKADANAAYHDGIWIVAFDTTDIDDINSHDFSQDEPFAEFHYNPETVSFISWAEIMPTLREGWKSIPSDERQTEYTLAFAMQYRVNDAGKQAHFTDSEYKFATRSAEATDRATKQFDFVQAIDTHNIYDTGIWDGSHDFSLISGNDETLNAWLEQFNGLVDGYTLTAENASDYLAIVMETKEKDTTTTGYKFTVTVPFANRGYSFDKFVKDMVKDYFDESSSRADGVKFDFEIKYYIVLKDKVGETDENNKLKRFFLSEVTDEQKATAAATANGGLDCQTHTFNKAELTVPNARQVRFTANDGGCFEFLREGGNGSIFTIGIDYVEIKLEKDGDSFSVYLFAADNGDLLMYKDTDKSGEALSCGTVTNGWLHVVEFNDWVRKNFEGKETFNFSEWTFSSKAHNDGNYYLYDSGYSETTTWAADTNSAEVPDIEHQDEVQD